ncbi:MAG TPA: hypothetical protein P5121_21330 [Caldilineaceae bacterium]|nr:hypothetical protein [Caldilineaceae bacterium]
MIKVTHFLFIGALLVGALLMTQFVGSVSAKDGPKLLEFDTMIGVPRPFTGATNAIRGVPGGGLPWVVRSAKGELKTDGKLEVEVKGLVFDPNDSDVINRGLANQNTVPQFRAIVSCLTKNGDAVTTVNVPTDPVPATVGLNAGDAKIEAQLVLPSPCIAPIIFVTNPGGAWFAATGS